MSRHATETRPSFFHCLCVLHNSEPQTFELNKELKIKIYTSLNQREPIERKMFVNMPDQVSRPIIESYIMWPSSDDRIVTKQDLSRYGLLSVDGISYRSQHFALRRPSALAWMYATRNDSELVPYLEVQSIQDAFNCLSKCHKDMFITREYQDELNMYVAQEFGGACGNVPQRIGMHLNADGLIELYDTQKGSVIVSDVASIIHEPDRPYAKLRNELIRNWSPLHG